MTPAAAAEEAEEVEEEEEKAGEEKREGDEGEEEDEEEEDEREQDRAPAMSAHMIFMKCFATNLLELEGQSLFAYTQKADNLTSVSRDCCRAAMVGRCRLTLFNPR
jgi:hypothetical protein